MSVLTAQKPILRYFDRFTQGLLGCTGRWSVRIDATGDASGGELTSSIVPASPFNRVYRLDYASATWGTLASAAAFVDRWMAGDILNGSVTTERFDASNSALGTHVLTLGTPLYWNGANVEEVFLRMRSVNLLTQAWSLQAFGVFYEPSAEFQILPFRPPRYRMGG